jgi:predicted HTH transcriptional regulator
LLGKNQRQIEMTTLRQLTIEEVTGILSRGAFAELISAVEHAQFECKSGLYDTKTAKGKIELAKDVSALANSSGGYLLIGPATTKSPLHQGDEVTSVSDFASSAFQTDTYRNILTAYIYPPITDLKIQ